MQRLAPVAGGERAHTDKYQAWVRRNEWRRPERHLQEALQPLEIGVANPRDTGPTALNTLEPAVPIHSGLLQKDVIQGKDCASPMPFSTESEGEA